MPSLLTFTWISLIVFCLPPLTVLTNVKYDQTSYELESLQVQVVDARNILRSRFHYCTAQWQDADSPRDQLRIGFVKEYWHEALHTARKRYPDSLKCLMDMKPLLQEHAHLVQQLDQWKHYDEERISAGLDAFLSKSQVKELRYLHEHGDGDSVERALERYFEDLPQPKRNALVAELLNYESKPKNYESKPKRVERHTLSQEETMAEYEEEILEPEPLKPEWLAWQTPRHKKLISKMIIGKANKWEVMNEIGDQFYHLRKELREQYKANLEHYCIKNIKNVIGESNFNVLRGMYMDTDPVEQIETKFHELVAELSEERERLLADHYGVFCRKIFRLVHFEPTDLTIWLTSSQKLALGEMIQNPEINDTQIYDKMYDFYTNTTGEAKDEARDIIESGCRHFIAHMFGDDNAEELEELRLAGSISKQHLAAKLASHALEVSNEVDRKRAQGSLSICSRIYLGYDGSCECHNHAESCDPVRHNCLNCTDNTYGVQCELCLESFSGDPLTGVCTAIEAEETPCNCNNHSDTCDQDGKCLTCNHNTAGDNCERCASGFYGDATIGTRDDCTRCPCPDNVDCFVNDHNLVECKECPNGKRGITCDEEATVQAEEERISKETGKSDVSDETKETEKGGSKKKKGSKKDDEEEQPSTVEEEDRSEEKPETPTETSTSEIINIAKDVTIDENKVEETF